MTDIALGDTRYFKFTSRAFATGIPTVLAGTPVISAYEDNSLTQITAGITLTVDLDGVVGLNLIAVVATSGNGFEDDKDYALVVTAGTVGGVSIIGEVIKEFSIQRSPVNWANISNRTTGIDLSGTNIQLVDTVTANTDMRGTDNGALATALSTAQADLDIITGASGVNLLAATQASIDAIEVDTSTTLQAELDAIQAAVITNAAGVDIAADIIAVKADTAAVLVDTADIQPKLGTPATNVSADIAAVKADTAAVLVDTAVIGVAGAGLTDLGGMSTGMKAEVNAEADTALTDYDPSTNAEMEARTPTAAQLAYIVSNAADGPPVTFTGGTTTTAILGNVDGSAASSVDDFYNGRILVFNAGTLNDQVTDITDYVGSTKTATITAVTTAVTSSHTANMK